VHVFKGNAEYPEAKYWLTPKPELVYSKGFTIRENTIIRDIILLKYRRMIEKWKKHFKNN